MRDEKFGYASVMGDLHKTSKMPNQDAYLVKRLKKGTILVVSDGWDHIPIQKLVLKLCANRYPKPYSFG